jgi:hypothetical protein
MQAPAINPAALLARHSWLGSLTVALLGLGLSMTLTASLGVPFPGVHDEFSYLLGADTFASGRVANPVHPMWMSFETFHVCMRPAYVSMYPPAQSLFLALGQVISHPIIGVWLSMAALGAASYWALSDLFGARWGFLGSALLVYRLCTVDFMGGLGYWAHSYWGGAVAATGGSLLLGGARRFSRTWSFIDGLVGAAGLGLLASSRPYEGFIMSLPVLGWLATKVLPRRYAAYRSIVGMNLLPAALLLVIIAGATGYYNFRTTGSPTTFARAACYKQYAETPSFLIGHPSDPIVFNHRVHAQWNLIDRHNWERRRTLAGFAELTESKLEDVWQFFMGSIFGLPLLALPWLVGSAPELGLILATIATELLGYLPVTFSQVHYMAPITTLLFALVVAGARRIASVHVGRVHVGKWLITAWLGVAALQGAWSFAKRYGSAKEDRAGISHQRERLVASLTALGGKHLVIARYTLNHIDFSAGIEVVYNPASIDTAPVIFAREDADCPASICGAERKQGAHDAELLRYFRDRTAWLYEVDEDKLIALPPGTEPPHDVR